MKPELTTFSGIQRPSNSDVSRKSSKTPPIETVCLFTAVCGGILEVAININNA